MSIGAASIFAFYQLASAFVEVTNRRFNVGTRVVSWRAQDTLAAESFLKQS